MKLKLLDLFSGIGGFSLGLERTGGFETVAFCEIDPHARKVLHKHWPNVPVFEDITTLTKDKLNERGISVDAICGGFPCQDISLAGKGAGIEGERSGLWADYARLIGELRPQYVIVENVSALLSRGLDRVLRDLAALRYDAEWHCIPASSVGAPHRRDRIWIVAYPCSERCEEGSQLRHDQSKERTDSGSGEESLPDSRHQGLYQFRVNEEAGEGRDRSAGVYGDDQSSGSSQSQKSMADSNSSQRKRGGISGRVFTQYPNPSSFGWWEVEPSVGRVAYGVPGWSHRLKQLGNAVVPQIPELIGRAILENLEG